MKSFFHILGLFFFLFVQCGLAWGVAESQTLSWNDCVEIALKKSPSLQAVEHDLLAAQQAIPIAESGFYPSLSLSANVTEAGTSVYSYPNPNLTSLIGPTLSWSLFTGFGTLATVRSAKANRSKTESVRSQTRMILLADLRNNFAQLLFAQKNVNLTERIERRLDKNASFVQLRYRGGLEARWAYLKAAADWKAAQWDTSTAELNLKTQVQRLAQFLGIEADSSLRVEGDFIFKTTVMPASEVLENHPDILVQKFNRDTFDQNIEIQLANYWPTLNVGAGYNFNGASAVVGNTTWSVGATLNIPIFSGFVTKSTVAQARSQRDREDSFLTRIQLITRANLEQTKNDFTSATQHTLVTEQQLIAARERATVIQEEYSAGLKTFLDWDQAQSLLTQAEKDHLSAQLTAMIAMAALERAQGKEI